MCIRTRGVCGGVCVCVCVGGGGGGGGGGLGGGWPLKTLRGPRGRAKPLMPSFAEKKKNKPIVTPTYKLT